MKKVLVIIFLCCSVLVLSACTGKEEEKKDPGLTTAILARDAEHDYYTALFYEETSGFSLIDNKDHIDKEGYNHTLIMNQQLNIQLEVFHREKELGDFEKLKEKYEKSEGFREYTWNNNPGFLYDANDEHASFILLADGYIDPNAKDDTEYDEYGNPIPSLYPKEEPTKEVLLYGTVSCLENKKCNAITTFKKKDFQTLLRYFKHGKLSGD